MEQLGKAYFTVTPELIKRAFGLPDDAIIVGCEWRFEIDGARFYVKHKDLPKLPEGAMTPRISWRADRVEDTGDILFIEWVS